MYTVETPVTGKEGTPYEYGNYMVIDTNTETGMMEILCSYHEYDESKIDTTEWVEPDYFIPTGGSSFGSTMSAGTSNHTPISTPVEHQTLLLLNGDI